MQKPQTFISKILLNSIRYYCQKICSWSRRPETILEIRKEATTFLKMVKKPIIWMFFKDLTNHIKKINRAVIFSPRPLCYILKYRNHRSDLPGIWKTRFLWTSWRVQMHSSSETPLEGLNLPWEMTHNILPNGSNFPITCTCTTLRGWNNIFWKIEITLPNGSWCAWMLKTISQCYFISFVHPWQRALFQSWELTTYREDLNWLHFDKEPKVQKRQKVYDQQSYTFVSVLYATYPPSSWQHKPRHHISIPCMAVW